METWNGVSLGWEEPAECRVQPLLAQRLVLSGWMALGLWAELGLLIPSPSVAWGLTAGHWPRLQTSKRVSSLGQQISG